MIRQRRYRLMFVASAFVLCTGVEVFAQFDGEDPFGGLAPAERPAAEEPDAAAPPADESDPVVLAIRESNPTTPPELARAVRMLIDLDRPDEAKRYLPALIKAAADKDTKIALHREFGSAFFISLSRYKPLAPEGVQFAEQVLDAAYQAARDPEYLNTQVQQLSDPSLAERRTAVDELRRAGTAAIAPMVQALADKSRSSEHAAIRAGLAALGRTAVDPLIGVLEAPDPDLRWHVILVLGRLKARDAVPYLLRPYLEEGSSQRLREASEVALIAIIGDSPTQFDAERFLERRARKYFSGVFPKQPDIDGMIELWRWDADKQTSVPRRYTAEAAALVEASRAAADLYAIAPNNDEYRQLYLLTKLESEKLVSGLDQPLPRGEGTAYAEAEAAGASFVEEMLVRAMETGHVPAAIAAAEMLGELGTVELLMSEDGHPRALARAMRHGDRRLRLTAAQAIMRIDPQTTYPGSSWLPDVLGYLVTSDGERRVLIGHPRTEQAQTLVAMLTEFGMEGESAGTGHGLLEQAVADPDIEMVLISDAVDSPPVNELIQMLRRDRKTARMPIAVLARSENLVEAKRRAELDPLTEAFPWPYDREAAAFIIRRLTATIGREAVTWQTRAKQASESMDALQRLAEDREKYSFYDLMGQQNALLHVLEFSSMSPRAAKVLAVLGTPKAQKILVNVASQRARAIEERRAAADAFREAVRRRRLLLTKDDILVQYDRYNQSENLDVQTQKVLGSILDTIEGKLEKQHGVAATPNETN